MPQILFVDTHLDWSNFSVAGNVRAMNLAAKPPVAMIHGCDLSGLNPAEDLYLSAHGSFHSSGEFGESDDLAAALQKGGLKANHQSIVMLTCSAAVDMPVPYRRPIAMDLKQSLAGKGYKNIKVEGGTGFVVVFPGGKQVVMPDKGSEAGGEQSKCEAAHKSELDHCKLLVTSTMKDPKPDALAKAVDEVAAKLIPFYADLLVAFKPYLKTQDAFKTF